MSIASHIDNKSQTNVYSIFIYFIFLSPFLDYLIGIGLIKYLPIIALMVYITTNEAVYFREVNKKPLYFALLFLPFSLLSSTVYAINSSADDFQSYIYSTLFIIPFLVLSSLRVYVFNANYRKEKEILFYVINVFLILQLFICIGQISTHLFDFGLPVVEIYKQSHFVSGTFYNPNNLSAATLILAFILIGLRPYIGRKKITSALILSFILIIIGSSRSALLLYCVISGVYLYKNYSKKELLKLVFYFILCFLIILMIAYGFEIEALKRVFEKAFTLPKVFAHGMSVDYSISNRTHSYIHFLKQLADIGMGNHTLHNYFSFSKGAQFTDQQTLFSVPHSIVVEIGYWLGWLGLILFFVPVISLIRFSKRKFWLVIVLLLATSIPSSIIGSTFFMLICFLSFMDTSDS